MRIQLWSRVMAVWSLSLVTALLLQTPDVLAMTRSLKNEPAIVIAAFGTTTKAKATYAFFEEQLKKELPAPYKNLKITWAYTSEIVREIANKRAAANGDPVRMKSLPQVLADLEAEGYRNIAVQSLHIFPGLEYEELLKICEAFQRIGLRIEVGGTLLHRWENTFATISILKQDFLDENKGCTMLIAHGTPETASGANATYLGIDHYLQKTSPLAVMGSIDGVLPRTLAMNALKQKGCQSVRLLPFMYVAGDHVMNDIMADKADKNGERSWAMELRDNDIAPQALTFKYNDLQLFKGLGFYPDINAILIKQLLNSLERITH